MSNLIGFLSPQGEFVECKYTEHSSMAETILSELRITTKNPEEEIANLGWIFLQSNFAGIPSTVDNNIPLTDAQINWIEKNYEKLNKKQKYFISEKLKKDEICKNCRFPSYLTEVNWSGLV